MYYISFSWLSTLPLVIYLLDKEEDLSVSGGMGTLGRGLWVEAPTTTLQCYFFYCLCIPGESPYLALLAVPGRDYSWKANLVEQGTTQENKLYWMPV
jgi:hypothetical protein